MMGSDFPGYDLDHTIDRVMELPVLSQEEKDQDSWRNAARVYNLN